MIRGRSPMAEALDLGSSQWGFDSPRPHSLRVILSAESADRFARVSSGGRSPDPRVFSRWRARTVRMRVH
jgi:hypothetical protein